MGERVWGGGWGAGVGVQQWVVLCGRAVVSRVNFQVCGNKSVGTKYMTVLAHSRRYRPAFDVV
jgi:hypothetical protein